MTLFILITLLSQLRLHYNSFSLESQHWTASRKEWSPERWDIHTAGADLQKIMVWKRFREFWMKKAEKSTGEYRK
jgi:hypothetical protein